MKKPDCYKCMYRNDIPGSAHSQCANWLAKVTASKHGIQKGWCHWPFNYDPIWIQSCNSFKAKEE